MAPGSVRALRLRPRDFKTVVVLTAQHREMLDQVMRLFQIDSDYDLNIMQKDQTLEHVIIQVLTQLGAILDKEKPDMRSGAWRHDHHVRRFRTFRVLPSRDSRRACVEAGLRFSYDKANPFSRRIQSGAGRSFMHVVFCAHRAVADKFAERKYFRRRNFHHRKHGDRRAFYRPERNSSMDGRYVEIAVQRAGTKFIAPNSSDGAPPRKSGRAARARLQSAAACGG